MGSFKDATNIKISSCLGTLKKIALLTFKLLDYIYGYGGMNSNSDGPLTLLCIYAGSLMDDLTQY